MMICKAFGAVFVMAVAVFGSLSPAAAQFWPAPASQPQSGFSFLFGGDDGASARQARAERHQAYQAVIAAKRRKLQMALAAKRRKAAIIAARRAAEEKQVVEKAQAPLAYAASEQERRPIKVCCATAQEAIDLVAHDTTLRRGDSYMTPNGPVIYLGEEKRGMKNARFIALTQASGENAHRASRVAALVGGTPMARKSGTPPRVTATAPAAPIASSISAPSPATYIVDARGRRVRLIGDVQMYRTSGQTIAVTQAAITGSDLKSDVSPDAER